MRARVPVALGWAVCVACEVASDFACDLPLLPEEAELPHHYRPRSSRRTA